MPLSIRPSLLPITGKAVAQQVLRCTLFGALIV